MLSKRAGLRTFSELMHPKVEDVPNQLNKRIRLQEEISFIPSIKRDVVKSVYVFLREILAKDHPFQITVALHDSSLGRLGYYDLSYTDLATAKQQYTDIIDAILRVREHIEYNMLPSPEVEKLCKQEIDAVLDNANMFDSSYHGKYRGRGTGLIESR